MKGQFCKSSFLDNGEFSEHASESNFVPLCSNRF